MIMLEKIKYYTRINQQGNFQSYALFDNIEFYKAGEYYRHNKYGRLHRYVYEYYFGPIPTNHDIHHIDFNKNINNINNLQMLTHKGHRSLHNKGNKHSDETKKRISENHADFSDKNNPMYKQRTPAMYEDIRNGMSYKEFMRKYKCSDNYYYNTKKEIH